MFGLNQGVEFLEQSLSQLTSGRCFDEAFASATVTILEGGQGSNGRFTDIGDNYEQQISFGPPVHYMGRLRSDCGPRAAKKPRLRPASGYTTVFIQF
jgi:hypothetical protein